MSDETRKHHFLAEGSPHTQLDSKAAKGAGVGGAVGATDLAILDSVRGDPPLTSPQELAALSDHHSYQSARSGWHETRELFGRWRSFAATHLISVFVVSLLVASSLWAFLG